MADEASAPFVSFAGGMFSGRVESTMRESAQATYYNLLSVDAGPLNVGATVTGSQTTQLNGYQIQASNTLFSTVAAGGACVLPQTNRPYPFAGLEVFIANTGVNNLICFPHPSDAGTINGQAANLSVVLGPNTITPFQCFAPGTWFADSIGTGFAGSLETVVSQGTIAAAGTTSQANSTAVTQAMVNVTAAATTNGVRLPPAAAGLQIVMNGAGGGAASFLVYPNGTDQINALGASAPFTFTPNPSAPAPQQFFCFVSGTWVTK
jgi:hypothetical protein